MSKPNPKPVHHATMTSFECQVCSTDDRRTKLRLRELCDEVIASFRAARGSDMLSAVERAEANQILAQLTPSMARSAS